MRKRQNTDDIDEVLMTLVYTDNLRDMQNLAEDLFTQREVHTIAMRWKVARMLYSGASYAQISADTGMSSATISRIAKLLERRSGGFSTLLRALDDRV